ncbi:hypothetical protein CDD83_8520 [Cordyceps sp. RAO-2017]|nr:hypothetical protein CDD83_8520 [Cordyceps sp. RAO-2017]
MSLPTGNQAQPWPATTSGPRHNPLFGEWIGRETIRQVDQLARQGELVDVFHNLPPLARPTAATTGSPHTQACVEQQRLALCAWAANLARADMAGVEGGDFALAEFVCACGAEGGGVVFRSGRLLDRAGGLEGMGWVRKWGVTPA